MRRGPRILLAVLAVDVAAIVISGGVSLLGPTSDAGFAWRVVALAALLGIDFLGRRPRPDGWLHAWVVVLLILLPLLHSRGYRLRGDGLWYYAFTHSLAFDGDIDLGNQYRGLGIDHHRGSQPVPQTGYARFTYPVGASILWVPFVGIGYAGELLRIAHGLETSGYAASATPLHALALGNLLLGWLGLLVLDRTLRRWFPPWIAFTASATIGLASFLAWYLAYHPICSHALTFLFVALFVKRWLDEPESLVDFAVLGLLLGVACTIRWQNGVFALLPAATLARRLRPGTWRPVLVSGCMFSVAVLIGFLPQIVSWKIIFDLFYLGVPQGPDFMRWGDPFLSEVLFSSRHGLFSWNPVLYVGAVGFVVFVKRHLRVGLPLLAVAVLTWYVNSTVADWWAGGDFGGRRFDSALPMLAMGLATVLLALDAVVSRYPRLVTAAVVGAAVLGNGLLMEQYRKGRLPVDDTMSWESAARYGLDDVFDALGYPFAFPMNWLFSWRYDRPKTQYDLLVGKYLFHPMHDMGGVIELGPDDAAVLGNGWTGLRDWQARPREVRLALAPAAGLFVPIDQPESLRLFVACAAPAGAAAIPVEVRLNGEYLGAFFPEAEMSERAMVVDARLWRRLNLLEFVPLEDVGEEPFLVVDRLRFERMND